MGAIGAGVGLITGSGNGKGAGYNALNGATLGFLDAATGDPTQQGTSGLLIKAEGANEKAAREGVGSDYNSLRGMVGAGPGQADVKNSYNSQLDLAAMLKQYSQAGGADPTTADISRSNDLAAKLFGGQRVAMQQSFQDQTIAANRQAALMGRSANDPILAAKLAQEQTRQSALLDANQGAYATQYAMQQPAQRLGYAQNYASLQGGLASQAMANRQALLGLGSQIQESDRSWRLNTADRWNKQAEHDPGQFFKTSMAAIGTGMSVMSGMGGMSGGTPAASAPAGIGSGMAPMTTGFQGGANYFNGINPYSVAGPGLQAQPQAAPGSYSFGQASGFGQPRTFSLGGY